MSQIHVRVRGNSYDIELSKLDLGSLSPDSQIREAVAKEVGVAVADLRSYVVERNEASGDLTLRPEAVFG